MDIVHLVFRWIHILMGIMWIGFLYFFNFVSAQFAATLEGESRQTYILGLIPRVLFWFRWGAFWTWISGLMLLMLVFYHGGLMFEGTIAGWGLAAGVMVALTFLGVFVYDALFRSGLGKNGRIGGIVGFLLIGVFLLLEVYWAEFSYRAFNIHLGALLGTIMAFNVWFRIWPAQKKLLAAIKEGSAPDPDLVTLVGMRSRHNTYLSVPLLWFMMNQHTVAFAGGSYGIPEGLGWVVPLVVIVIGWHVVFQLYKRAGKLTGV